MIKIYANKTHEGLYTVMVIDDDMVLYSDAIHQDLINQTIDQLVEDFSDTDREVRVYRN